MGNTHISNFGFEPIWIEDEEHGFDEMPMRMLYHKEDEMPMTHENVV